MWEFVQKLLGRVELIMTQAAALTEPAAESEQLRVDRAGSPKLAPRDVHDPVVWDRYWNYRVSAGRDGLRVFERPINPSWSVDPNDDRPLVAIMFECGLRTVLCAGNGISPEPRALAAAGFDVTALDLSPAATRLANIAPDQSSVFCDPQSFRAGGRVEFVTGDLLDVTVCPGPFDVVIERHTVHLFPEHERRAALEALAGRLSEVGIFLSQCHDPRWPSRSRPRPMPFHVAESWFREQDWTVWDGQPGSKLSGRVGWLIRTVD